MRLAALCTALALATPTLADEVWVSEMGPIVYEAEENGAAIFSFTNVDAYPATLVIPGLAGNYDNRGTHDAFWIGTGAGSCPAFLTFPGSDQPSTDWGRAVISFDSLGFPTGFLLKLGWCFEDPRETLRAVPD